MIKNISFKFKLFDAANKPIVDMPVNIQYFNMVENQWISVYKDVIKEGLLIIDEKATSRAKALKLFLDKIKGYEIPELRIIPEKQIFDVKKQEVLSITYEFELLQEEGLLNFDFGTAWLLDSDLLAQNDRFKTFCWITTPYSIVNQKENLAKISELEKSLILCNTRTNKLDLENKNLTTTLQNLSKQFEELNALNKSNLALANERSKQIESLKKDLDSCKKENEKLQKSYNLVIKDFEEYKKDYASTKPESEQKLKELEEELTYKARTIEDLKSKLEDCNLSKINLEENYRSSIITLEKDIASKHEAFNVLENLYNDLKENYQSHKNCKEFIEGLEKYKIELKYYQEKFKNLEYILAEAQREKTVLISAKESLILEKNKLNEHLINLNEEVSLLQIKLSELSKEIVIEDRPVAVKNIYKNLVQELDIASELSKSNNYSLSNLSIKLKGVINQDANSNVGIQLFSKENANQINGNAISDISFDIVPTPRQTVELGKVPDVSGLTETAVTRILESVGLKLNPVYQKSEHPNGASFKQTPKSGSSINSNEFVTVIFSKNE